MKFILDQSIVDLGMTQIIVAKVSNIDPNVPLTPEMEAYIKDSEQLAFSYDREAIRVNHVIKGYRDKMTTIGKSVKKNLPTAEALIKNIQRRGSMSRVNPIVDIYNAEALHSFLAIGAHDFDKINEQIEFTRSERPDTFLPIGSEEKVVEVGDIVYRDTENVVAYLDSRDSELYKITPETKNLLLIMQGNENTTVAERIESMERICQNLQKICECSYQIEVVEAGENNFF